MLLKFKVIKDDGAPGSKFAPGLNFHRRGPGVSGPRPIPKYVYEFERRHMTLAYASVSNLLGLT